MITTDQFYSLVRDAARSCPVASSTCLQINGFRAMALSGATEMTTPSFGVTVCDKEKPYYWGRKWAEGGYLTDNMEGEFPALTAFRANGNMTDAFNARQRTVSKMEVAVVDRYYQDQCEAGACGGCEGRTIMEIFRDTETLLTYVLKYLGNAVHAVVGNIGEGLFNETVLEALRVSNEIPGYDVKGFFGDMLAGRNIEGVFLENIEFPAAKLYGTAAYILVPTLSCDPVAPVAMLPDSTALASCCK